MRREELESKTKQELLELARKRDIPRRTVLSRDGLIRALLTDELKNRRPPFAQRGPAAVGKASSGRQTAEKSRPRVETPRVLARRSDATGKATPAPKGAPRPAPKVAPRPVSKGVPRPAPKVAPWPAPKVAPTPAPKGMSRPAPKVAPRPAPKAAPSRKPAAPPPGGVNRSTPAARTPAPRPKTAAPGAASAAREKVAASRPAKPVQRKIAAAPGTPQAPPKAPARPAAGSRSRAAARPAGPDARRERSGPYGPAAETLRGGALTAPAGQAVGNGRPTPRAPLGSPLEMPERYGRDHAGLLVRDPYWLHAYWEVTPETLSAVERELGEEWRDHRLVLRVLSYAADTAAPADDDPAADRYDIELPPGATSWYLNAGRAERAYRVIVGILTRSGRFRPLVRTNDVRTPRDSYSTVTDEEWTTTPAAFRHLYEQGLAGMREGRSSAELGMLLRERLGADWSSGMLGSMGSGAMVRPAGQRGFWFVLDAELIVFGATEPNATVTMQGRPIRLRPDGTFTLRFQLPDGTQVIDATAVSADGVFRKTITPTVRRETHVTEMISNETES